MAESLSSSSSHISLLAYKSFETLPLDLAKSIGNYLPLSEFRQLHCVSHTTMRIAGIGKPFRLRSHDCTRSKLRELFSASSSQLRAHVCHIEIIAEKPKKRMQVKEGDTTTAVVAAVQQASQGPKLTIHDEKDEDEMEMEKRVSDESILLLADLHHLYETMPQLETLSAPIDLIVPSYINTVGNDDDDDNTRVTTLATIESLRFRPTVDQLIFKFRNSKEHYKFIHRNEIPGDVMYPALESFFIRFSTLPLTYLELNFGLFSLYSFEGNAERLSQILSPLVHLAPTLTSLNLIGTEFNLPYEYDGVLRWTHADIVMFRSFTHLEGLVVCQYWTVPQLSQLLAEPIPFPSMDQFTFNDMTVKPDSVALLTRLPKLTHFQPILLQTPDISYLSLFTQLTIARLICDENIISKVSLIATLPKLQQLTLLTLRHSELTNDDLHRIFVHLNRLEKLRLVRLSSMTSLEWLTSIPHFTSPSSSFVSLTLSSCENIMWSEIVRLNTLKQGGESLCVLEEISIYGNLQDRTVNELEQMRREKSDQWPAICTCQLG